MEFFLLGRIEVRHNGRLVDIGHARQRHVLAVLLAEPNRVVTADQLADRVWGQKRLPADPAGALQTYVSLLRRALAGSGELTITWQPPGYLTVVDEQAVDLHRFRSLVARASSAAGQDAATLLAEGLGLWRGDAFAGLDTPWISDVRAALAVQRHTARLDLTDIWLRLGQHAAVLPQLAAQAAEHRLDERVAGQLMLALYRSGRQADALTYYETLRQWLSDELAADPSPPLQRLHRQILITDPALASPPPAEARAPAQPAVVPRQLPAAPRSFTGRGRELAQLNAALDRQASSGATLVISAIGGAGGIGKTWLALHWAHQNLDRFPDGQLYVNLRGFDPSGEPLPAQTAIRRFLDGLGVPPAAGPADLDTQAGMYRSIVAGKRMLIVADNAREAGQVIPLLPGSPACTVLVTSRQRLTGLIAAHGAIPVELDVLGEDEARQVLIHRLGHGRVTAEPDAVADLLASCAGLPLALSVMAARAAAHPRFQLALLASELREAATRLDALEDGDLAVSVRATLSWSFHALGLRAARMLVLLGLAPGPDISLTAVASLTALAPPAARTTLRELEAASLLHEHAPDRYRMHDLIRLYAAEQAGHDQPQAARAAALDRLTCFYLHTAVAADRLLAPHRPPLDLGPPPAGCAPRQLPDTTAALTWFRAEHSCLLATQRLAIARGWPTLTWQLAWALNTFHLFNGHLGEQVMAWQAGLTAAGQLGQPGIQAMARRLLGDAHAFAGHHADALSHLNQAISLAEKAADTGGQAHGHRLLGRAWELRGNYQQALQASIRSLELFRALGDPVWEALALNNVGWHHAHLGHLWQARTSCEAALGLYRHHHNREGEAATLDSLGYIALHDNRPSQAVLYYSLAHAAYHDAGHAYGEADSLDNLAQAHAACGDHDAARRASQQALTLYQAQHRSADVFRLQQKLAARRNLCHAKAPQKRCPARCACSPAALVADFPTRKVNQEC